MCVCPDEATFQKKFSLQRTHEFVTYHKDRMIFGTAPTLSTVRRAYNDAALFDWLNSLVLDYAIFCGQPKGTNAFQIDSISHSIVENYPYLKVTEIMLFFSMAKGSLLRDRYGDDQAKMYGTFSGHAIMSALRVFMEYRSNEINRMEEDRRKAETDTWLSARSQFVDPLLKKMREDMEAKEAALKEQREKERQRIIDEHNREFKKMLESRKFIK